MDNGMDEKSAELLRSRSRAAFDAQAPTYDTGTEGVNLNLNLPRFR